MDGNIENFVNKIKDLVINELVQRFLDKELALRELKAQKAKKRNKLVKKRTTELLTCYSEGADKSIKTKINTYRSLIEHLAFIDVMLQEFQEDIVENGIKEEYQNGKNQSGLKKNDSVDLFKKWYSERLSDSERLKRLLSIDDEAIDDNADDFFDR